MNKRYIYFSQASSDEEVDGANMKNVEIFRVGEFHGGAVKFTLKDLKEMVANFLFLKKEAILPNVPVRADHPAMFSGGSVDKIVGYIEDLRIKGEKLVADFKITEQYAMDKIKSGTYRSRSIELGIYEDNSGDEFYPTVMGLAFVDLPAVEGLDDNYELAFSKEGHQYEYLNKEEFAKWTRKYINSLPDSSFAAIEPAYKNGESKDKNARHLPFKEKDGSVDLPHLRNALARVNQIQPVTDSISAKELRSKALKSLKEYRSLLKEEKDNETKAALSWWDNQVLLVMSHNNLTNIDMDIDKEKEEGVVEGEAPKGDEHETKPASEEVAPDAEEKTEEATVVEETETASEEEGSAPEETASEKEVVEEEGEEFSKKSGRVVLSKEEHARLSEDSKKLRGMEFSKKVDAFEKDGKTSPAMKELEQEFMMSLSESQLEMYSKLKEKQPKLFELGDSTETPAPEKVTESSEDLSDEAAEKAAEEFLKETE